jgi:ribosomal protein L7/L12
MLHRAVVAALRAFLVILDKTFMLTRKNIAPPYPYDKTTQTIRLPKAIERELRQFIAEGNKVEALRRVTRLTGAGLRVSKDYVDRLASKDRDRTGTHRGRT